MSAAKCKVLIVDDDLDTREALSDALSEAGFAVEQEPTGAQALEHIERQGQPDVILLDLRMPGMDGAQFLERIQDLRARVTLLTADSSARLLRLAPHGKLIANPPDLAHPATRA